MLQSECIAVLRTRSALPAAAAAHVATALRSMTALHTLVLHACDVSDGSRAIVRALACCDALRCLILKRVAGSLEWEAAAALSQLQRISVFDVHLVALRPESADDAEAALPAPVLRFRGTSRLALGSDLLANERFTAAPTAALPRLSSLTRLELLPEEAR